MSKSQGANAKDRFKQVFQRERFGGSKERMFLQVASIRAKKVPFKFFSTFGSKEQLGKHCKSLGLRQFPMFSFHNSAAKFLHRAA